MARTPKPCSRLLFLHREYNWCWEEKRNKITYPNIPSAIRPAPHSGEVPVPIFKGLPSVDGIDIGHDTNEIDSCDTDMSEKFSQSEDCSSDTEPFLVPKPLPQAELNDLVRDLGLSKKATELGIKITRQKSCLSLC